jgi:hypothetical protein
MSSTGLAALEDICSSQCEVGLRRPPVFSSRTAHRRIWKSDGYRNGVVLYYVSRG